MGPMSIYTILFFLFLHNQQSGFIRFLHKQAAQPSRSAPAADFHVPVRSSVRGHIRRAWMASASRPAKLREAFGTSRPRSENQNDSLTAVIFSYAVLPDSPFSFAPAASDSGHKHPGQNHLPGRGGRVGDGVAVQLAGTRIPAGRAGLLMLLK